MKYQDVENVLNQVGLKEVSRTDHAIGFASGAGPAVIYINTETKTERSTLILHPDYESQLGQLVKLDGVYQGRSKLFSALHSVRVRHMKYQDVENVLNQVGLKEVSRTDHAIGFASGAGPAVIYINTETKTERSTLILHPDYESQLGQLVKLDGVYQGRSNFRSSDDYVAFPDKSMAIGGRSYFGLSFSFESKEAVIALLKSTRLI